MTFAVLQVTDSASFNYFFTAMVAWLPFMLPIFYTVKVINRS